MQTDAMKVDWCELNNKPTLTIDEATALIHGMDWAAGDTKARIRSIVDRTLRTQADELAAMREAVEWYADSNNWEAETSVHQNSYGQRIGPSRAEKDRGDRAKAALASLTPDAKPAPSQSRRYERFARPDGSTYEGFTPLPTTEHP